MSPRQRLTVFESLEVRRLFAGLLSDALGISATASVQVNGTSYFFADDGLHGSELWKRDGLTDRTLLVKDLTPGSGGTSLESITRAGGRAVFVTVADQRRAFNALTTFNFTVWSSDGTADGTVVLAHFDDAVTMTPLKQVGDRVAFAVTVRSTIGIVDGSELTNAFVYFTDGTQAGTQVVKTMMASADHPAEVHSYRIFNLFATGNGRVVFMADSVTMWSSDGTPEGNVALSSNMGESYIQFDSSPSTIVEVDGRVIIPGQLNNPLRVTDGTPAGTESHPLGLYGVVQHNSTLVVGRGLFFVQVGDGTKTLWRLDLDSFTLTRTYDTVGDAGNNQVVAFAAGERIIIFDTEYEGEVGSMWVADGTAAPATKLLDIPPQHGLFSPVVLDGSVFFGLLSGDYDPAFEGVRSGFAGSRIWNWGLGGRVVNTPDYKFDLWRSDGTPEGTGVIRPAYDEPLDGKHVLVTLSAADGALLVRTEVFSIFPPNPPSIPVTLISEETVAYGPGDLSIARDGASVRVVNGVLRLGGSPAVDDFRLYRSPSEPDELIVEYNGYTRTFPFNSIRRIAADLQDGDDRFEIAEQIDGEFRLWTSITGGGGADTIIGGTGRDTIFGGSGNDFIRSRGNKDLVNGGPGRDRITGGEGDDILASGGGHDSILAGTGVDVLFGQDAVGRRFARLWATLEETEDDMALQSL